MSIAPPPLAVVGGALDIAPVAGLGGGGAMLWRGACFGCGAVVACAPECPQPECTGCGRRRHGVIEVLRPRGQRIPPTVSVLYGEGRAPATNPERAPHLTGVVATTILRPAAPLAPGAAPGPVRKLAELAAAEGWPYTLTAAVAADERGVIASVALRVRGCGFITYHRRDDSWSFRNAVVADPVVRPANVGRFTAALLRAPYAPPERTARPPAPKVPCPQCGAEVSLTAAGKIYASHRCASTATEGRS